MKIKEKDIFSPKEKIKRKVKKVAKVALVASVVGTGIGGKVDAKNKKIEKVTEDKNKIEVVSMDEKMEEKADSLEHLNDLREMREHQRKLEAEINAAFEKGDVSEDKNVSNEQVQEVNETPKTIEHAKFSISPEAEKVIIKTQIEKVLRDYIDNHKDELNFNLEIAAIIVEGNNSENSGTYALVTKNIFGKEKLSNNKGELKKLTPELVKEFQKTGREYAKGLPIISAKDIKNFVQTGELTSN